MDSRIKINLAHLRTSQGKVTQRQLAAATGIAQKTISELESGKTSAIDFNILLRLCDYFNCTPNDILIVDPELGEGRSVSYSRRNQALISELAMGIGRLAAQIQPIEARQNNFGKQLEFAPPVDDKWSELGEPELGEKEQKVLEFIGREPVHFDVLVEHTGMPAGELAATLTMLQLAGSVHRPAGDWYKR